MRAIAGILLVAMFLGGCAQPPRSKDADAAAHAGWRGRLALRVENGQGPQSFSAGFELSGTPQAGELVLSTPFGTTLATLTWTAQDATLRTNGEVRHFESVDALATQATGAALPIAALFLWLSGQHATAAGWQADLSQLSDGRLMAQRTHPEPAAELRIVLDR